VQLAALFGLCFCLGGVSLFRCYKFQCKYCDVETLFCLLFRQKSEIFDGVYALSCLFPTICALLGLAYFCFMKKTHQLFEELIHLNSKEASRFQEFVDSPYFNKHEGIRQLVAWIIRHKHVGIDKEALAQHLFGDDPKRHQKLAPLLSQALRLYEQWLGIDWLREKKENVPIYVAALEHLRFKGAWKYHEKFSRYAAQKLQQFPTLDFDTVEWSFKLAWENEQRYLTQSPFQEDPWLQEKVLRLDTFFAIKALVCGCEIETRRAVLNIDIRHSVFLDWLVQQQQLPEHLSHHPLLTAFYYVYLTLKNDCEAMFHQAMDWLKAHGHTFEQSILGMLYTNLGNFCTRQINKGKSQYLPAMFELYQIQLDQDLLLIDGYLSEWQYKNIVSTGLLLGHNEWVYEFIHTYKNKLIPETRNNAFTYNLAYYYYATGQLEKVLELLVRVEYRDVRYYIGAKTLLLKTYYDLNEGEALRALVNSIKRYLKRKDIISATRRKAFLNFLDLLLKFFNLRENWKIMHPSDVDKHLQRLHRAITRRKEVVNPRWLEEKWQELLTHMGRSQKKKAGEPQ